MFEISRYSSISQYKYSDPTIRSFLYTSQNAQFSATIIMLNVLFADSNKRFIKNTDNSQNLFLSLLSIYLLFVLFQGVLGYYLMKSSHREERLFLAISPRDCRKFKKQCADFLMTSRVLVINLLYRK